TTLAAANLNTGGGDVSLTAGAAGAGDLSAHAILTAGSGNITLQATGGTITQSGTAAGLAVSATADGDVTVDALRGSTVGPTSTTLANSTPGRQIDLGTNAPGKIGLTSAELSHVTAGVLHIGSATAGAINVSAAVNYFNSPLALINADAITEAASAGLNLF